MSNPQTWVCTWRSETTPFHCAAFAVSHVSFLGAGGALVGEKEPLPQDEPG